MVDRGIIAIAIFLLGFTPLFSTTLSGIEGSPDFHSKDFFGPWIWGYEQLDLMSQYAIIGWFIAYFSGKFFGYFFLNKD